MGIHGGLSSIGAMAAVISEMSKKFHVIAVDCPGRGRSEQAETPGALQFIGHGVFRKEAKLFDWTKLGGN